MVPDLVAGAFDSIKQSSLESLPETTILFKVPRDKDFTDGELATAAAVLLSFDEDIQQFTDKEGHRRYQAFEACSDLSTKAYLFAYYRGDRVDHQLANLALARLLVKRGAEVFLTDGQTLARMVQGPAQLNPVFPPDCFEPVKTGMPDKAFQFSAQPLDDQVTGFTLKGLRWELDRVDLTMGRSLALSNRADGLYPDQVSAAFDSGTVFFYTYPEGL